MFKKLEDKLRRMGVSQDSIDAMRALKSDEKKIAKLSKTDTRDKKRLDEISLNMKKKYLGKAIGSVVNNSQKQGRKDAELNSLVFGRGEDSEDKKLQRRMAIIGRMVPNSKEKLDKLHFHSALKGEIEHPDNELDDMGTSPDVKMLGLIIKSRAKNIRRNVKNLKEAAKPNKIRIINKTDAAELRRLRSLAKKLQGITNQTKPKPKPSAGAKNPVVADKVQRRGVDKPKLPPVAKKTIRVVMKKEPPKPSAEIKPAVPKEAPKPRKKSAVVRKKESAPKAPSYDGPLPGVDYFEPPKPRSDMKYNKNGSPMMSDHEKSWLDRNYPEHRPSIGDRVKGFFRVGGRDHAEKMEKSKKLGDYRKKMLKHGIPGGPSDTKDHSFYIPEPYKRIDESLLMSALEWVGAEVINEGVQSFPEEEFINYLLEDYSPDEIVEMLKEDFESILDEIVEEIIQEQDAESPTTDISGFYDYMAQRHGPIKAAKMSALMAGSVKDITGSSDEDIEAFLQSSYGKNLASISGDADNLHKNIKVQMGQFQKDIQEQTSNYMTARPPSQTRGVIGRASNYLSRTLGRGGTSVQQTRPPVPTQLPTSGAIHRTNVGRSTTSNVSAPTAKDKMAQLDRSRSSRVDGTMGRTGPPTATARPSGGLLSSPAAAAGAPTQAPVRTPAAAPAQRPAAQRPAAAPRAAPKPVQKRTQAAKPARKPSGSWGYGSGSGSQSAGAITNRALGGVNETHIKESFESFLRKRFLAG